MGFESIYRTIPMKGKMALSGKKFMIKDRDWPLILDLKVILFDASGILAWNDYPLRQRIRRL